MPENNQRQRLKDFFNTLEDRPLEPTDPYYCTFWQDSDSDPIAELADRISFSRSESVNLFTGQRGCGKSTEFRRLKQVLESDGCEVYLLDMREYMNLTTAVEISDFLVSIMAALSDEVERRHKQSPGKRGYLERLVDFLNQEINIDSLAFKTDVGTLKASLKDDPNFKQRLQDYLKGHVAKIVSEANRFAQETVELIRKKTADPDKKVVVLVDSVEQIRGVGAEGSAEVHSSVENLFSGHASSLQIPMLHIVYTIPPYLTSLAPGLGRLLGGTLTCTLPSVHVQGKDNNPDPEGLKIMRQLVAKRYSDWLTIFAPTQLDTLSKASGGDLRDFFRLLRDALVKAARSGSNGGVPIQTAIIEQTINHIRREMLPIASQDKAWLRKIAGNKKANLESIQALPDLARFFDTNLVLNYRNGDDWYDVHPLLKEEINM